MDNERKKRYRILAQALTDHLNGRSDKIVVKTVINCKPLDALSYA